MGQITNATQGKALAKANPAGDFKGILAANWHKIAAVMPKHMSEDRMFQLAMSAYNSTPQLAECSTVSVLSCIMKCAALGMEPSAVDGLGRAYILPFRNGKTHRMEATFILGYKGMIDLARRSGEVESISARAVYEGDEFRYAYGLNEDLYHVPMHKSDHLIYTYCIARFKDGGHYFIVLSRKEIEAARKASKAGNSASSPWLTNYDSMAVKTAIRRAFPYLPVSIVAQEAAAADEQTPDYSSVLSPVVPTVEQEPAGEPEEAPAGVGPETGEIMAEIVSDEPELADEDIAFPGEGEE